MSIILQYVGNPSFASRLIEWKGSGQFSHVDIVLPDERLLGARSDKTGGAAAGVQIRTPNYDRWFAVSRLTLPLDRTQTKQFMDFAFAQIGKPYDKMAIFAFILNRNWDDSDAWFCDELVMACASQVKGLFDYPLAVAKNKIDVGMSFAILSTYGVVKKVI
jgi:hypothetical protein